MSNWRRYEILLPLKFNDGQRVPWTLIGDTLVELRKQFGAASWETQIIHGIWQHQEAEFHDQLVRVFVDVEDRPANRLYFSDLKKKLKSSFRQIDIWMTTYPIETIS
jgi:hypothetical protein